MRELHVNEITKAVATLCVSANRMLPSDLQERLAHCRACERLPLAQSILADLEENLRAADELSVPICQDTGMAVIFAEVGQDVHLVGGSFEAAVREGVRLGYVDGLLRCSVVGDPLRRVNTNDNTPPILHTRIVEGAAVRLTVAPKGFGSENMSAMRMFTPAATREDIMDFIVSCVREAGGNPCPPVVVGVGIGGDFEYCAYLAKAALCRPVSMRNPDPLYTELEEELLRRINDLGIGPQGFGGDTTALAVNIEQYATHIAGLPVSVNMGCHVTRHQSITL